MSYDYSEAMVWLDRFAGSSVNPDKVGSAELRKQLFPKDSELWTREYCKGWVSDGVRKYPSICALFARAFYAHWLGWFANQQPYQRQVGKIPGLLETELRKQGVFLEGAAMRAAFPQIFGGSLTIDAVLDVGDMVKIGEGGFEHYGIVRGYSDTGDLWCVDGGQGDGRDVANVYRRVVRNGQGVGLQTTDKAGKARGGWKLITGIAHLGG